ncbi:hypothetical protein DSUL_50144 [Desulfovibrionales bacterium]
MCCLSDYTPNIDIEIKRKSRYGIKKSYCKHLGEIFIGGGLFIGLILKII